MLELVNDTNLILYDMSLFNFNGHYIKLSASLECTFWIRCALEGELQWALRFGGDAHLPFWGFDRILGVNLGIGLEMCCLAHMWHPHWAKDEAQNVTWTRVLLWLQSRQLLLLLLLLLLPPLDSDSSLTLFSPSQLINSDQVSSFLPSYIYIYLV